jgi:trk system potassium uptake protein TrkH
VRLKDYLRDAEFRVFIGILIVGIALGTLTLWLSDTAPTPMDAFRRAIFQTISMQTTTGFRTDNFSAWPATPLSRHVTDRRLCVPVSQRVCPYLY